MVSGSIFSSAISEIGSAKEINEINEGEKITILSLDLIDPDPGQPRKEFDEEKMEELKASIAKDGVLQPITVRGGEAGNFSEKGRFVIVLGERRYRACQALGLETVPVIIKNDYDSMKSIRRVQWAENIMREDLSEEDSADVIIRMLSDGLSQSEISEDRGISQARISHLNSMRNKPAFLEEAWKKGIVESASINAEIKRVWKKNKEAVEDWVNAQDEKISLARIRSFEKLLKEKEELKKNSEIGSNISQKKKNVAVENERVSVSEVPKEKNSSLSDDPVSSRKWNEAEEEREVGSLSPSNPFVPEESSSYKIKQEPVPKSAEANKELHEGNPALRVPVSPVEMISGNVQQRIVRPKLVVEFYGKRAILLLHKKPSNEDKVWIKYHQDGDEAEVDSEQLKIKGLFEGE
ncbi:ParB/RepB/Spo0J family partition protein [Acetobacteraceae bacterium]|nr:ParB/RepB/Spo0J family partition protein [Acetobacteraceae bacterium]